MKGLGTNDETLIRIVVGRAEIDLAAIKSAFDEAHPEHSLAGMICSDTSGNYEDLLLKLLGETKENIRPKVIPKSVGGGSLPRLSMHEVASGKITREMLDSKDVFVFDVGFEVFVW